MTRFEPDIVHKLETSPFSILMVCTGNICRSPFAEQVLRARLNVPDSIVTVGSAGTHAMLGGEMSAPAAELSVRYGADPSGHRPRQLSREIIADADLVFTATREHRREVVSLYPLAARYAFTLKQFARLVGGLELDNSLAWARSENETTPAALRRLAAEASGLRGLVPPPAAAEFDDIVDPYREAQKVYDAMAGDVDWATTALTRAFSITLNGTQA